MNNKLGAYGAFGSLGAFGADAAMLAIAYQPPTGRSRSPSPWGTGGMEMMQPMSRPLDPPGSMNGYANRGLTPVQKVIHRQPTVAAFGAWGDYGGANGPTLRLRWAWESYDDYAKYVDEARKAWELRNRPRLDAKAARDAEKAAEKQRKDAQKAAEKAQAAHLKELRIQGRFDTKQTRIKQQGKKKGKSFGDKALDAGSDLISSLTGAGADPGSLVTDTGITDTGAGADVTLGDQSSSSVSPLVYLGGALAVLGLVGAVVMKSRSKKHGGSK